MKIAIWLIGGMRSHWKDRCYQSFKQTILNRFDCDLYVVTSKNQGGDEETIKYFYPKAKIKYVTESSEIPGGPNVPDEVQTLTWYRTYLAKSMTIASNKQYDLIIRARPDIEYRGNFPDFVFTPSNICWIYQHPWKQKNLLEYDDRFAIGSPEVMYHLADLYNSLPEYYSSSKFGINQNNSEHALFQHLSETKVAHFVLNNDLELNCKFVKRKDGGDEDVPMLVSISSLELIRDNNPDLPPSDWRDFV